MCGESGGQTGSMQEQTKIEKPLLGALAGRRQPVPPIWLMRQAGRYLAEYRAVRQQAGSFLDLCYTPDAAAEVTLQPVRRFGMDAAILFSDILVVPHALGQDVAFVEGEGPKLDPVRSPADLAGLSPDRLSAHMAPVYETVARVADGLPKEVALIGFAGAPWTVATYMVEEGTSRTFERVRAFALGDEAGFGGLIALLVEATTRYLVQQVEAGAEAVQLFDSWSGVLPESQFAKWVIAPTAEIVRGVRAVYPDVPIIGFPRGAGSRYEWYATETGISALALDETLSLDDAVRLQARRPVQGNLDPMALLLGGAVLEDAVLPLVEALVHGPYVFNLGHGINKETPPDHVETLVRLVREKGARHGS